MIVMVNLSMSRLSNLKELLNTLQLCFQVQTEISSILEDYEVRLYSLEEDRKRLLSVTRSQQDRIRSLDQMYSEALYKIKELKECIPKE